MWPAETGLMELVRPAYQGPEFCGAGILPDNVWDWWMANILMS